MTYFARAYVGGVTPGTLVTDIDASVTTFAISVTGTTAWDILVSATAAKACIIAIDYGTTSEEKVLVPAGGVVRVGTTVTFTGVSRGYDGSSATTHQAASAGPVTPVAGAIDFTDANAAVQNTIGQIAANGDLLVGTGAGVMDNLAVGAAGSLLQGGTTPTWLGAGTANQYLRATGSGVAWQNADIVPVLSSYRASGTPTLTASTWTAIPVNTSEFTAGTGAPTCDYTTNLGRHTINKTGLYKVDATAKITYSGSPSFLAIKSVAGATIASGTSRYGMSTTPIATYGGYVSLSQTLSLSNSDKLEVQVWASANTLFDAGDPRNLTVAVTYLGPLV